MGGVGIRINLKDFTPRVLSNKELLKHIRLMLKYQTRVREMNNNNNKEGNND